MPKKFKSSNDTAVMMNQIQEQLAVMNEKLDSFMTKSLTELAQALANSKPAPRPHVQAPSPAIRPQNDFRPQRQMYAIVCFECGKDTEIPFKPSGNRPVYCPECFAARKNRPAPVTPAQPLAPKAGVEADEPKHKIDVKIKKSAAKTAKVVKRVVKKAGKKKGKR